MQTGMGRVEYFWRKAFEERGFTFVHIGPAEVGKISHPSRFPALAFAYFKSLNVKPYRLIVHEPASGYFIRRGLPCVIESHGIERRYWDEQLNGTIPSLNGTISLKSRVLFPLWRLRGCDRGLRNGAKLLLINTDDKEYAKSYYKRREEDILVFKNGVNPVEVTELPPSVFTVLMNATWIERKGIYTLIEAAGLLNERQRMVRYLLIGTSKSSEEVLRDWPAVLRSQVEVVPKFSSSEEAGFLASSSVFVLPSFAEGQPLSLLQAMASAKCCITTNCSGQKDIIDHDKTGLLFERGDAAALADLIAKCMDDREWTKQMGKQAKAYTAGITWQRVSEEVVDFVIQAD